ncbi:peptidylprolyl isomerase [Parashewanella curva]|uniref:Peptidyl-prolyl cis-trans isomerase n=1 Tax=Parashewanella curva TaxID=2338552 RepID=A0A3L8Q1H8_9GAMM|nr:peptidylprolyl isomerase [Parashewanella curva]
MKITKHSAVTVHYRLSEKTGELIEDSFAAEPMYYLHGANNMIPALESALEGKAKGEKVDVEVAAKDAYGEPQEELIQEVPLTAFGEIEDIVPGMRFMAETDNGQVPVVVTEVKDESIIVDGNHPLTGKDLSFHLEVVDVREATEEEVAHGHIHAPGASCGH